MPMRRFDDSRWAWFVAVGFVMLTLAALLVVPLVVQRSVDVLRARIEASEPARTLLMRLQFNLVRESGALREYLATGDTSYVGIFQAARVSERNAFQELEPLARDMGSRVFDHFVQVRTLAEIWHRRMNETELLERGPEAASAVDQREVRLLLEQVLLRTTQLDSVILTTTAKTRREIVEAERTGLRLTLLSGALAMLAALAVAWLVWRMRSLAIESERRRLETVAALAESARAAESRARLLRGITHDVKNPIGAAKGYAELLELGIKGELTEEQRTMVRGVQRSLESALAIISDLLDLARTDSGGITVHRVKVDLGDLVQQAVEDHRATAERAGHNISCDVPSGLQVFTDPTRVRQVLDNLLSNAIKYTPPPGQIMVSVSADARDAPRVRRAVAIRVSDSGPGIPAEKREHIFDEFTRLEDNDLKGHGLGLAIARRIARLLGGDLDLAETNGRLGGATFVLWLPRRDQPYE